MADLPYHPLADAFPLIEGAEFDELVSSTKENGQREAIVLLDGSILDGRNRYRACKAAGVEPVTKEFTGTDPLRFVIDVNMRRRHLSESQRGMIGARLATMKASNVAAQRAAANSAVGIPTAPLMTLGEAAALMNVSRDTVSQAKKVWAEASAEEIKAVQDGKASVNTIARQVRANPPPAQRKKHTDGSLGSVGKNPERIENMRIQADVWARLDAALTGLTNLPKPSEVAAIVRANHSRTKNTDARLQRSLQWLEEFANDWRGSREVDAA